MASHPLTKTFILQLKERISLEKAIPGTKSIDLPAVKTFLQLTDIVKAQPGFLGQYWGHEVEDKDQQTFVWVVDWESADLATAFSNSEDHKPFLGGLAQVFDLDPALSTNYVIDSRLHGDAAAAMKAPVTEVAFMTLPSGPTEEAMARISNNPQMKALDGAITTVGKCVGHASGFVSEVSPPSEGPPISLHAVFGYPSIEDHWNWRQSPECAKIIEGMEELSRNPGLKYGDVVKEGYVGTTGMFHVHFRFGA